MRGIFFSLLMVLLLGVAVLFAALNPGTISVEFAFGEIEVEKSVALIAALVIGWMLGLLCALVGILRLLGQRRSLRRSLRLAEQEVQALRSIPVQDAD